MRLLLTLVATGLLAISVGCAPEAAPKTAEAPAAGAAPAPAAAPTEGATADAGGEFQTVSLKVPGMT